MGTQGWGPRGRGPPEKVGPKEWRPEGWRSQKLASGLTQNDPEKPKRTFWVVHGRDPRPQFHEKEVRRRAVRRSVLERRGRGGPGEGGPVGGGPGSGGGVSCERGSYRGGVHRRVVLGREFKPNPNGSNQTPFGLKGGGRLNQTPFGLKGGLNQPLFGLKEDLNQTILVSKGFSDLIQTWVRLQI